jgi:ADP-ribose pyrophosphatase YjhB (NUDIX family)
MKYCSNCAAPVVFRVPTGDHLPRFICEQCDTIHYQNPRIIVGCLPLWEDKIMLCKRSIAPRFGFWNVPGGFMENGETVEAAVLRELWEETGTTGSIMDLHTVYTNTPLHQVHLHYLVQLDAPKWILTPESSDIQLFTESEIVWEDIAFASNLFVLKSFFEDRRKGIRQLHRAAHPHLAIKEI